MADANPRCYHEGCRKNNARENRLPGPPRVWAREVDTKVWKVERVRGFVVVCVRCWSLFVCVRYIPVNRVRLWRDTICSSFLYSNKLILLFLINLIWILYTKETVLVYFPFFGVVISKLNSHLTQQNHYNFVKLLSNYIK